MNKRSFLMKKKLMVFLLVLMAATASVFANGQSESTAPAEKTVSEIKIGVSLPTLQEERWKKDKENIVNHLIELGVSEKNIFIQSADGDEQKQVTQCENLITQGIDALILIPQNGAVCAPIVDSAHDAGIKLVSIDRIINNSDLDFFVTYDAFTQGALQGEYITNLVQEGNWIMIGGAPTDPNAAVVRSGQMKYVQPLIDAGKVKVVLDQDAKYWNPADALKYTEQGLTANNNDIQVVFTSNDGCAGAAIEALTEQGLAGSVPVPGLDADLAACQRIVAGTQSMTVYRRLNELDSLAADVAFAFATGKEVSEVTDQKIIGKDNGKIKVPTISITDRNKIFAVDNSNMEEVVKDGWQKASEIYKNVPKSEWPAWTKNYN
jgi:D-xylose transport system substrate-binding protein